MTIVERIEKSDATVSRKIVQLYCVVMLNYRQPLGDAAWAAMARVTGNPEYTEALAYLMGMTMGDQGLVKPEVFRQHLTEIKS